MEQNKSKKSSSAQNAGTGSIEKQMAHLLKNDKVVRIIAIIAIIAVALFAINYFLDDPLQLTHTCPTIEAAEATPSPAQNAGGISGGTPTSDGTAGETPTSGGTLEAYFIDIGQGDCIFLEAPDGTTMLVDAGDRGNFPIIDAFLKERDVERLDVVVATHMHADHIGSMAQVIDSYDIGTFYMPEQSATSNSYTDMMDALEAKNVPIKVTKLLPTDTGPLALEWAAGVEVLVLSPFEGKYANANDYSIVMRVQFGATSLLLTGDAETTAERILLKALPHQYVRATVLKVGHHGSSTSTCDQFLSKVSPQIAVISCGAGNKYGHPEQVTLDRLQTAGVATYRTDLLGTIHVTLDGVTAWVVE